MSVCRICQNAAANRPHRFREMMFGTRDEFDYFECSKCGTLQISQFPDLARYYPSDYYSYNAKPPELVDKWTTRFVARSSAKHFIGCGDFPGKALSEKKPWTRAHFPDYLCDSEMRLSLNSRILDVGCGNGALLEVLQFYGFSNLTGVDAFIEGDSVKGSNIKIFKRDLNDLDDHFDLIMFNHSLEHFTEPTRAIESAIGLLRPGGTCLVRIPVLAQAWKKYGGSWVQLDPPRHTFLFSETGFCELASKSGFVVRAIKYDSTAFQFWGSEMYESEVPLIDWINGDTEYLSRRFGEQSLANWDAKAAEWNKLHIGDQACFYLEKA